MSSKYTLEEKQAMVDTSAILETLYEFQDVPVKLVILYLALDHNLSRFEVVRYILEKQNFVTIKNKCMSLTEAGKEVAKKLLEKSGS